MQICKSKKTCAAVVILLAGTILFAIDMPDMPEMPSMPSMPAVGGSFYTPSFPSGLNSKRNTDNSAKEETEKAETILTEAVTPDSLLSTVYANSGVLTAYDISSLYDSGLFSNLSSLTSANSLTNYATSTSTNILLQQVLNSLNELKKQQQEASAKEKNALDAAKTDSEHFKNREPSVLRFKVNGYNILDSLTEVFFSETEPDGTFLLTGDRKYFTNQQVHTETFYMLFKTVNSNGSSITY